MTEPIRLLHFSDLHIGVENYGGLDEKTGISSRVLDFIHRLDEVKAYAEAHDVDLIICAGDVFHSRRPTPTYQREFAWRLLDMAKLCPVVLLVGNHDLPAMLKKATSIEIFDTLEVPNVIVGNAYEVHQVETKRGPVQVATAPYPHRARLLEGEDTAGMSIAEVDALLREKMNLIFDNLAKEAVASDAPRVLTAHLTVEGAAWGSERGIMAGRDAAVQVSTLANRAWDYVALGHIHKHQNLTKGEAGRPAVVYPGSLERVDFGEEGDAKGFCWVELARGATTWDFVPVQAREFQTIIADVRDSDDPTADVLAKLETYDLIDKVVRLRVKLTPENEALLQERDIRSALRSRVHHTASIQKQIERPVRGQWTDDASPETMTPIELLDRYLKAKDTPEDHRKVLLQHAEKLLNDDI